MPAGFKYDLKPIEASMPEMCRFETVYRYSGGFNLDISNLTGVAQIPPLTPLVLDFVKRTAKAVINVEVAEKITAGSTSLKIKKNSQSFRHTNCNRFAFPYHRQNCANFLPFRFQPRSVNESRSSGSIHSVAYARSDIQ